MLWKREWTQTLYAPKMRYSFSTVRYLTLIEWICACILYEFIFIDFFLDGLAQVVI